MRNGECKCLNSDLIVPPVRERSQRVHKLAKPIFITCKEQSVSFQEVLEGAYMNGAQELVSALSSGQGLTAGGILSAQGAAASNAAAAQSTAASCRRRPTI